MSKEAHETLIDYIFGRNNVSHEQVRQVMIEKPDEVEKIISIMFLDIKEYMVKYGKPYPPVSEVPDWGKLVIDRLNSSDEVPQSGDKDRF